MGNDNGKACAILTYFLVGIIWYFVDDKMRKNQLANYHTKQALVLLIASVVINIIGSIIPIIGWFIILPLGNLFILVLWIFGIINSASGNMKPIPVIGGFGSKFQF